MARLPIPGADGNIWGMILNDYLSVSLDTTGSLKEATVSNTALQAGSVTPGKLSAANDPTSGQSLAYNGTNFSWVSPTPSVDSADFLISKSGSTYFSTRTSNGSELASNDDAAQVLMASIDALGSSGGTIVFKADTYTWGGTPRLPHGLSNWLRIVGEPGTKITLSSTGGTRFLDFDPGADPGDTFRKIQIEGFTVNAAALGSVDGTQHVLVGDYGMNSGLRCHYEDIVIRRMRGLNLRVANSGTAHQLGIFIAAHHSAAGQPQTNIKRILIEDIDLDGGNHGVTVYGNKSGAWAGEPVVRLDEITIRNIKHDMRTVPTSADTTSHVHVGSLGFGGTCTIENIWGAGSRDVGIEVDGMMDVKIRNVYVENFFGFGIALTNYNAPDHYKAQSIFVENVVGFRDGGGVDDDSSSLLGIRALSGFELGWVYAQNLRMYRDGGPALTEGIEGEFVSIKGFIQGFSLRDSFYFAENTVHSGAGLITPSLVYTDQINNARTPITFENVHLRFGGQKSAGGTIAMFGFLLNGNIQLDMKNCAVQWNWVGAGEESYGIDLGGAAASTIRGTIDGFSVTGSGLSSAPRGIRVMDTSQLTIPAKGALRIKNSDFSTISTADFRILFVDATNKALTYVANNLPWPDSQTKTNVESGTSYTLVSADADKAVECTSGSAVTVTVPPESSVDFPIGTTVHVTQMGTGAVSIAAGAGVEVRSPGTLNLRAQYSTVTLRKRASNEWVLSGDNTP